MSLLLLVPAAVGLWLVTGGRSLALERARVVLDADRRREIIRADARSLAFAQGLELVEDAALIDEVAGLVYDELRRLAGRYLNRERPGQTLQTHDLIHEAFLRLMDQRGVDWQNRAHFFGIAARMMRRILTDHARKRGNQKHGGKARRVELDDIPDLGAAGDASIVAVDEALTELEAENPDLAKIVELRYFAGMSVEEAADVMRMSPATLKRRWSLARAWLFRELSQ